MNSIGGDACKGGKDGCCKADLGERGGRKGWSKYTWSVL